MDKQKNISSEKVTDQSSNQSTISDKLKFNQNQPKNLSSNLIKEEKKISNNSYQRKYTMEPFIFRKEFVPVLKPIEIHLVPSKFRLNDKKNKHKNTKEHSSCISCPCSEEESDIDNYLDISNSSDISDSSDLSYNNNNKNVINNNINENGLKDIRKKFIRIRTGSIHKVMTKRNLINKKLKKQYVCFDLIEKEKDKENLYKEYKDEEDSISSELYEDNNLFNNYSMKPENKNNELRLKQTKSSNLITNSIKNYDNIINNDSDIDDIKNNDKNDKDANNKKRNRIYSFSILDTLKNKLKIDK